MTFNPKTRPLTFCGFIIALAGAATLTVLNDKPIALGALTPIRTIFIFGSNMTGFLILYKIAQRAAFRSVNKENEQWFNDMLQGLRYIGAMIVVIHLTTLLKLLLS